MNKNTLQTTIEYITPSIAQVYLDTSPGNFRSTSQSTWMAYASDMARGNWELNGESIKFDSEGRLVDGHHRLQACIEAGRQFHTIVVRGVQSCTNIDNGRKRSDGNYLAHAGFTDSNALAAATRVYLTIKNHGGMVAKGSKPTRAEIVAAAQGFPHIRECLGLATSKPLVWARSQVAGVFAVLYEADRERLLDFAEKYTTGAGLVSGDPILALRNRLLSARFGLNSAKVLSGFRKSWHPHALIVKAWNAAVEGRPLFKVLMKGDEAFPEILGQRPQERATA